MNLHEDKTVFRNLVLSTAKELKMEPAIVEKDYYLTLVLRNLEERIPGILFKGGTAFVNKKVYHVLIKKYTSSAHKKGYQ